MRYRFLITILMTLLPAPVQAGPWLRDKGSSFMAVSVAATFYLDTGTQTYLEYGLTDKTTVIADVGIVRPRFGSHGGYTTVSMRRALTLPDAKSKWAYELGVGVGWIGSQTLPHARTALTWGRGMTWGDKSGWATVDAAVIWDLANSLHVTKIDATVGVNLTDITAGMLQIYTAHIDDQSIATFAPSLVFKPKNAKFRIQIGAESEIGRAHNTALKIGLWREF